MAATRLFNVCVEHHAFFRLRGLGEPKKRSLLPAFPVRRYQDSSSMLNSPPIYPSGNGVSRPLSNFRPVVAHPKDTSWFTLAGRGMGRKPTLLSLSWLIIFYPYHHTFVQGCRANKGIKAPGAYYFEAACLEDGLVRIGWSTNEANLELGADNCGFGFGSDAVGATGTAGAGRAMHRNAGHDYGVPVHQSDVIGCLLDLDKGSVSWSCNGKVFPRGFTIPDQLRGESFFPDGHMNGAIASQYQYQPSMYNRDVNNMNPIYLDGQQIMANGHPIPGAQGTQRYLPPGVTIPSSVGNIPSALATVPRPTFEAEHWRISPADRTAGLGIDTRGLDVAAQSGAGWQASLLSVFNAYNTNLRSGVHAPGCRANKGIKAPGAYYFEAACLEDGLVRIGWSTNEANLELGADNCGFGFGSDAVGATGTAGAGRAMHRNAGHDYGVPVHQSDVIGCLVYLDKGSVSWSCNGKVFPRGFTIPDQLRGESFFPAASLKDSRILFNFGDQALEFHPGGPFVPVAQVPDDSEVPNRNIGWRLNPYDASAGLDVAPDGSMVQAQLAQGWQGCRANQGIRGPGRFYFEITPLEQIGLCRVGWSTEDANLNLGTDWFGFGYGADNEGFGLNGQQGKRMHNDEIENYGELQCSSFNKHAAYPVSASGRGITPIESEFLTS
ncbi:hypothetical protein AHF37_08499 [Paragonimus kellicotti]|nr:hypothetical protein AHF37_08499 [Paragonimus kellicotti]